MASPFIWPLKLLVEGDYLVNVVRYFIIKGNEDICFPKGMVYHSYLDISSSGVVILCPRCNIRKRDDGIGRLWT